MGNFQPILGQNQGFWLKFKDFEPKIPKFLPKYRIKMNFDAFFRAKTHIFTLKTVFGQPNKIFIRKNPDFLPIFSQFWVKIKDFG